MGKIACLSTCATVVDTRLRIDLTTVGGGTVTVFPSRIANETTGAVVAGCFGVGTRRAGIAAVAAMVHRRVGIRFASIAGIAIAVSPARITSIELTRAIDALASAVGEFACVVAETAVLRIVRGVGFTAWLAWITIRQPRITIGNVAYSFDTDRRSAVGRTFFPTGFAVRRIRHEVGFTTIIHIAIAICEALVTLTHHALAIDARSGGIGKGTTQAAGATIVRMAGGVEFATVVHDGITIAPSGVAIFD